jgi:hypothetical protein
MSSRSHRPTARFPNEPTLEGHTDESELPLIEADDDATPVDASRRRLAAAASGDETPTRHNPMGQDAALKPTYGEEISDPGHKPAFLYVDRGPGAGQLIPVKQGSVVVGRISTADLRINHPSVSRQHAQVTRRGDEFTVEDLGSQNGTYVNRRRVRGPTPVLPGDEVTVGTALLKLRGPGSESLTGIPSARSGRTPVSSAVKVALFAGAVGAGIAATLVFAFVHLQASASPAAPAPQVAAAPVAVEPEARPRMVIEDEPVVVDVVKGSAPAPSAVAAPEPAPAPAPAAAAASTKAQPASPRVSATAAAARRAAEATEPAAKAPASQEAADEAPAADEAKSPGRAAVLARFETGKVDAAIEAAEAAGDRALTADLVKFRDAFNAAKEAKEAGDVGAAIKQYGIAQKLDEKLSSGWSSYSMQIKKQLASVYARVGEHYLSEGKDDEARKAFQLALKQEPGNAAAKAGMAQLGGDSKPAKRANIEDAFAE